MTPETEIDTDEEATVSLQIDIRKLTEMLDERLARALPSTWPTEWHVRSDSVADHLPWNGDATHLEKLPRDVAIAFLVDWINEAFYQYIDGVSEDAHEPYGGFVTIDGDVLRVRFGRLPRADADLAYLAPEVEPIPIRAVVTGR